MTRSRRGGVEENLEQLQQTFQERLAKQAPDDLEAVTTAVRTDTVYAATRSAAVEMICAGVQFLYKEIRGTVAFLIVIPWAVLTATAAPLWLRVALLLAGLLLLVVPPSRASTTVDAMTASGLLMGMASAGWLFFWPADGLSPLEALGLAGGTVLAALGVVAMAGRVLRCLVRPNTSAVVLVLVCAGEYVALRYHGTRVGQAWWEAGLSLGVVLGLGLASVLALLQFGLAAFQMARKLTNLRMHPEAEFTECTLFTAVVVAEGGGRAGVVAATEYLAAVLERGIAGVLCREDPVSAEFIRSEMAARARHLRAIKRQVLFGRPGWQQELLAWADIALLAAARRDWLALPAADVDDHTTRTRPALRLSRIAVRLIVFLLPVAVLAAAWWSGMALDAILPAVLPFVVVWMAVQVGELTRHGTSAELSRSAAATDAGSSLMQNVSQLFTKSN